MSEQAILAALNVENVRANIEHICERIPSRLAGSENGRRMAEYSCAALRGVDVDATVHTLPGLVSFPDRAEFKVIAPVEMTIVANTLGHSTPTPPDGISGVLLDVYSGAFKDYEGKDARDTITLSELSYHPARHEKQRVAGLLGAAGCVMMNWGADDNAAVPFGSVKPAWGNPTPDSLLIPLESTAIGTYGHDPYGLTSQTTMIPCLYDVPRAAALPEAEERWMLETKLVRQRNRVADALGDARALIDETLKGLR